MKDLVVVTFANEADGQSALARVRDLAKAGQLEIGDSAVITKDADGKTHVTNEVSADTKTDDELEATLNDALASKG